MKTQVNFKIDSNIKRSAQKRATELGLSLSSVVNATLGQFARTGQLELSVAPRMTKNLEDIIVEARKEHISKKNFGPFKSADEMINSLDAD